MDLNVLLRTIFRSFVGKGIAVLDIPALRRKQGCKMPSKGPSPHAGRRLEEKQWDYILFDNAGELVLSVLCGKIGVYAVDVTLDGTQAAQYRERGTAYLDELAALVRNENSKRGTGSQSHMK